MPRLRWPEFQLIDESRRWMIRQRGKLTFNLHDMNNDVIYYALGCIAECKAKAQSVEDSERSERQRLGVIHTALSGNLDPQ